MKAREHAVRHMASQTVPLIEAPISSIRFWARGFQESYKTELRPEASDARSEEIVQRYADRYDEILSALYGPAQDGLYSLPQSTPAQKSACKRRWFLRRLLGKPMTAIRVLNSAATFDGGLDYVMRKLYNHSAYWHGSSGAKAPLGKKAK